MQCIWKVLLTFALILVAANRSEAQLTAEHRRELLEINKSLVQVAAHVRRKEFDEAEKLLADADEKVDEIASAANLKKDDRALAAVLRALARQRAILDRALGTDSESVSFVADVAPLIESRCLECHSGGNPRANLRLDTFANWKRGGKSGTLLIPGNAGRSLLMARLSAPQDKGGMPQEGQQLSDEQLKTIAGWINAGARFDGSSPTKSLSEIIFDHDLKTGAVEVPKPKGNEKVSFTRDIAPWFQNMCVRCHNERRSSGGLSLVSFYTMMKGGDSGQVVIPGDMENSRLFRLVGGLENPRMPNDNDVRITRQNYEDLKTWFREGNTFDGTDPRTPLSAYVKTPEELEREKFAKMTDEQFRELRQERSRSQYDRAVPNEPPSIVRTDDFLLIGNVPESRLREVQGWAQAYLPELQKSFGDGQSPWRGGLAIFVLKDRFTYDEFNVVIEDRRANDELTGHSKVTPTHEDAYLVLLDVGDQPSPTSPGLKANLLDHMTGAILRSRGAQLPQWLLRGTGLSMAAASHPGLEYFRDLTELARQSAATLSSPEELFREGALDPASAGALGYALVDHLTDSAGKLKFKQFVRVLQDGTPVDEALQTVYGAAPAVIARSFMQDLGRRR